MTIWRSEWESLSGRINGLLNAGQFFIRALGISSSDSYNVADKHLGRQARDVVDSLQTFLASHATSIPPLAADALRRFLLGPLYGLTAIEARETITTTARPFAARLVARLVT